MRFLERGLAQPEKEDTNVHRISASFGSMQYLPASNHDTIVKSKSSFQVRHIKSETM